MRALLAAAALLAACPDAAFAREEWVDQDKDGRAETRLFYEGAGVARAESDVDGDGRTDRWVKYAGGKRYAAENDRDGDGRMDRWDFYTREGEIGRTGKDTDGDGRPDAFTTLLNGRQIVMKEEDRNGDGKIDRRRFCEWTVIRRRGIPDVPGHKPLWTEADDDFDGAIDVSIDKKDKAGAARKRGKPMDGRLTAFPGAPEATAEMPAGTPEIAPVPPVPAGKPMERGNVDRMNARYGLDPVDWEKEKK